MALYQRAPYQTADSQQVIGDESDQEEDALVNDYQEQVQFDDGLGDLDRTPSMGGGGQLHDMQAQLAAAATPLEYQATLETKFASYDSYCNLFHYILNSEGPVDLEVPSVSLALPNILFSHAQAHMCSSITGPGMLSTNSSISSNPSAVTAIASRVRIPTRKRRSSSVITPTLGDATRS